MFGGIFFSFTTFPPGYKTDYILQKQKQSTVEGPTERVLTKEEVEEASVGGSIAVSDSNV